jgi:hypothetical protein
VLMSPFGKFLVSRETDSSKNVFGWFLKPCWAEEKGLQSGGTGRRMQRLAELRKSNFAGLQSQFCDFFLFRNSAIDLVVRNISELRRCGLKLRMPTFANDEKKCVIFTGRTRQHATYVLGRCRRRSLLLIRIRMDARQHC